MTFNDAVNVRPGDEFFFGPDGDEQMMGKVLFTELDFENKVAHITVENGTEIRING